MCTIGFVMTIYPTVYLGLDWQPLDLRSVSLCSIEKHREEEEVAVFVAESIDHWLEWYPLMPTINKTRKLNFCHRSEEIEFEESLAMFRYCIRLKKFQICSHRLSQYMLCIMKEIRSTAMHGIQPPDVPHVDSRSKR